MVHVCVQQLGTHVVVANRYNRIVKEVVVGNHAMCSGAVLESVELMMDWTAEGSAVKVLLSSPSEMKARKATSILYFVSVS